MQEGSDGNDASRCNMSKGLPLSSSSSSSSRSKIKRVAENNKLYDDLLGIICKKLNIDDLFQFAGVCQSWRLFHTTYWKTFMESKSPFIVQKSSHAKKSLSFMSIPDRKFYDLKMDNFWGLSYCGISNGYLIFGGRNTLLLMNPFTRREKKVSTLGLRIQSAYKAYRALLAFMKFSRQFVIVVYSSESLNVYKSANGCWVCYHKWGYLWKPVDVVVFRNVIYVLTAKARIGKVDLNCAVVGFREFVNTPEVDSNKLRFVRDDDKLFVVHFSPGRILDLYEIDFTKMEYVKLDTLDGLALFYSPWASCHAMRDPNMWGYCSNRVYSLGGKESKCEVYDWGNNLVYVRDASYFGLQARNRSKLYWVDWCFKNLHDEVETFLV